MRATSSRWVCVGELGWRTVCAWVCAWALIVAIPMLDMFNKPGISTCDSKRQVRLQE